MHLLGPEEVSEGGLIAAFHGLGRLCEEALPKLKERYRAAAAKHADETGWRTDGHSGYAWIFCSSDTALFEFRETRSARVAREVPGDKPLPGVLIVDRYAGYNQMPCNVHPEIPLELSPTCSKITRRQTPVTEPLRDGCIFLLTVF